MLQTTRLRQLLRVSLWLLAAAELLSATGIALSPHEGLLLSLTLRWPYFVWGLVGVAVVHAVVRPRWRELALAALLGVALFLAFDARGAAPRAGIARWISAAGLVGLGSAVVLGLGAARLAAAERRERLHLLLAATLPSIYALGTNSYIDLTGALHPATLDLHLFAFEWAFGDQPSFLVGRLFLHWPALALASMLAYFAMPVAIALVSARQLRFREVPARHLLSSVVLAGLVGYPLYYLYPAAGPAHTFVGLFPTVAPELSGPLEPVILSRSFRNAMPSLHTAWALLVLWSVRGEPRWMRWGAAGMLALTVLATLGSGNHYLVDLVVALPFTLAVRGLASTVPWARRSPAVWVGATATLTWLLALHVAVPVLAWPPLAVAACSLTAAVSVLLERDLARIEAALGAPEAAETAPAATPPSAHLASTALGAAAWGQLLLARRDLAHSVGDRPEALLLGVLAGLAAGLLRNVPGAGDRPGPAVLAAACVWSLAVAALAPLAAPLAPWTALPLALASGALLGWVAARLLALAPGSGGAPGLGPALAAQAAGAGLALLLVNAVLLPSLGTLPARGVLAAVGLAGATLAWRRLRAVPAEPSSGAPAGAAVLAGLALGGVWRLVAHLLPAVVGDGVYASLLPLALGLLLVAAGAAGVAVVPVPAGVALAVSGLATLALAPLWESVATYLGNFDGSPAAAGFATREVVRGAVVLLFLAPPAVAWGAGAARAFGTRGRRDAGRTALAGALAGAAGACLLADALLPLAGSRALLAAFALLAAVAGLREIPSARLRVAVAAAAAALAFGQPGRFDPGRLAPGAHVQLGPAAWDRVLAAEETLGSGVVARLERGTGGTATQAVLVNGHLPAEDGLTQPGSDPGCLAEVPLGFAPASGRAVLVGLGGRRLAEALAGHGLAVDAIADEPVARVAAGARAPWVRVLGPLADRRRLLARSGPYDVVHLAAGVPWSPGVGARLSREDLAAAAAALGPRGLVHLTLPLYRLTALDLLVAVGTARSVLPRVWAHVFPEYVALVACRDCSPGGRPARPPCRGPEAVLGPEATDRLLASVRVGREVLVSTDASATLEYSLPRGAALDAHSTLAQNRLLFLSFAGPPPR